MLLSISALLHTSAWTARITAMKVFSCFIIFEKISFICDVPVTRAQQHAQASGYFACVATCPDGRRHVAPGCYGTASECSSAVGAPCYDGLLISPFEFPEYGGCQAFVDGVLIPVQNTHVVSGEVADATCTCTDVIKAILQVIKEHVFGDFDVKLAVCNQFVVPMINDRLQSQSSVCKKVKFPRGKTFPVVGHVANFFCDTVVDDHGNPILSTIVGLCTHALHTLGRRSEDSRMRQRQRPLATPRTPTKSSRRAPSARL